MHNIRDELKHEKAATNKKKNKKFLFPKWTVHLKKNFFATSLKQSSRLLKPL